MTPPKPFTTDGCSGFMSFLFRAVLRRPPPWEGCCVTHDRAYHQGGPNSLRLDADIAMMRCVRFNGHPHWAVPMFIAVRLAGMWWLPFPSLRKSPSDKWYKLRSWRFSLNEVRWGYGYPYPQRAPVVTKCDSTFISGMGTHLHVCTTATDQHTWTAKGEASRSHLVAQFCPIHRQR